VLYDVFPDSEALAAEALRDAAITGLDDRVYSSIPKTPTYPLITVSRSGGAPGERHRLDSPLIHVQVWGTNKGEAHDIAQEARVSLHELEGASFGDSGDPAQAFVSGVQDVQGLTWLPDAESKRDRYVFTLRFFVHS